MERPSRTLFLLGRVHQNERLLLTSVVAARKVIVLHAGARAKSPTCWKHTTARYNAGNAEPALPQRPRPRRPHGQHNHPLQRRAHAHTRVCQRAHRNTRTITRHSTQLMCVPTMHRAGRQSHSPRPKRWGKIPSLAGSCACAPRPVGRTGSRKLARKPRRPDFENGAYEMSCSWGDRVVGPHSTGLTSTSKGAKLAMTPRENGSVRFGPAAKRCRGEWTSRCWSCPRPPRRRRRSTRRCCSRYRIMTMRRTVGRCRCVCATLLVCVSPVALR